MPASAISAGVIIGEIGGKGPRRTAPPAPYRVRHEEPGRAGRVSASAGWKSGSAQTPKKEVGHPLMAERIVGERQELRISRIAAQELGRLRARLFFTSQWTSDEMRKHRAAWKSGERPTA